MSNLWSKITAPAMRIKYKRSATLAVSFVMIIGAAGAIDSTGGLSGLFATRMPDSTQSPVQLVEIAPGTISGIEETVPVVATETTVLPATELVDTVPVATAAPAAISPWVTVDAAPPSYPSAPPAETPVYYAPAVPDVSIDPGVIVPPAPVYDDDYDDIDDDDIDDIDIDNDDDDDDDDDVLGLI